MGFETIAKLTHQCVGLDVAQVLKVISQLIGFSQIGNVAKLGKCTTLYNFETIAKPSA